jgi:hypothetical protein
MAFSFLRLSGRFYGKEEAPKVRPQPQYAGVNAPAYPAPAFEQPAPQPSPAAAAPAQTAAPPAPEAPAPEAPAEEPAAEAQPEEAKPEPEEAKPEPEEAKPAGDGDDVYERVLKEQLDKGVSPKVAEGRAKAAALKAKRAQGGE